MYLQRPRVSLAVENVKLRGSRADKELLSSPASRITSMCPFSLRGIHAAAAKVHLVSALADYLSLLQQRQQLLHTIFQ